MQDADPDADIDLLRRWAQGDAASGSTLVERYFGSVYAFFHDKVDGATSDDLAQQTFLTCVEQSSRFAVRASFKAFLLGIARNVLLMHYRAMSTDQRAVARLEDVPVEQLCRSPSSVAAYHQEQRLLLRALRRIPLDCQLALELHYWEGLRTREIAQILDIPEGTVKSRLIRARELLIAAIQQASERESLATSTVEDLDRWIGSLRALVVRPQGGP